MNDCKVMLVDDDADFLSTLVKRLRRRRLDATDVNSSEEALARLEQDPFDVVILDVKMPGMDGIEALREIKKRHPLLEVILLTGHADVEVAIEGMELGAFDYLVKPAEIDELLYKIQDAHQNKSIQEAKIRNMKKTAGPDIGD